MTADHPHPITELRALTDTCVHCGFCLPACPTYQLWGEEMDSPRGRIHLLGQLLDGAPPAPGTVGHFDACLGCLACVPACPSGVRYDEIIAAARAMVANERPMLDRLLRTAIFALFPHPRRLRLTRGPLRLARRLGLTDPDRLARWHPTLGAAAALAPPLRRRASLPSRVRARGTRRAVVGLLTGCVQDAFFSHVSAATARVLAREGCDVIIPRGQGCCGALAAHSGRDDLARRSARRITSVFARAGVDLVVTDVAGCGSALKEGAAAAEATPRIGHASTGRSWQAMDVSELLVALGEPRAPRHRLPWTVAYHDACHLSHGQRIRSQPRQLLAGIPDLRLVTAADPDTCCGSAGIYNLVQPATATELGRRKATALLATRADVVAAGNPGCLLQIGAALRALRVDRPPALLHTIEVLDASLAAR